MSEILAAQGAPDKGSRPHQTEIKRRDSDEATLAKVLATQAVQHALAEARTSFWQGKFIDAEKQLLTLQRSAACRIPECDALLARVAMQKTLRAASLVAAGLHSSASINANPIPSEHREAALVCLRANLTLAMQPSPEAAQLLTTNSKTPAFQGVVPFVGDSLAFAHVANWSPLHALADRIAADCNGSQDPVVQLHQIEAALLAGDALVLCNRWDEAKAAYAFARSQGKGHTNAPSTRRIMRKLKSLRPFLDR